MDDRAARLIHFYVLRVAQSLCRDAPLGVLASNLFFLQITNGLIGCSLRTAIFRRITYVEFAQ
jgi:hypothetical protein